MKKIKNLLFSILVLGGLLIATGCGDKSEEVNKPDASRVTIDVNPSFELIVDGEKKVVAVTAMNDDASVLLYGEVIVGKSVEEATETIVNLTVKAGYIDDEVEQNVVISVSGDGSFKEELENAVSQKISHILDASGLKAAIQKHEALSIEHLRLLVLENSTYTEEEVNAMTEEQLIVALRISRIETAELLNEEMRKLYFEAKNYEISFTEREETAKVIEQLGGLYTILHSTYNTALTAYRSAITEVENLKYDLLLSSESIYQQTLTQVLEAKTSYLEQKKYVATLETGPVKVEAQVQLNSLKTIYDELLITLQEAGDAAKAAFDRVIAGMKQAEATFVQIEEMFDDNIKATLNQNAQALEAKLNEVKNSFFTEFEAQHQDDLNAYSAHLQEQKEALQATIK